LAQQGALVDSEEESSDDQYAATDWPVEEESDVEDGPGLGGDSST
jgi:hypothetical protein